MRLAGAWLQSQLDADAALRQQIERDHPPLLRLIKLMQKHAQSAKPAVRLDIVRAFAEKWAAGWLAMIKDAGAFELLLDPEQRRDPADGLHAVAEIAIDMHAALHAPEGARPRLDPLMAHEAAEVARQTRVRRSPRDPSTTGAVYVKEAVAETFGVSPRTAATAIGQGRKLATRVEALRAALPPGGEILFVLSMDAEGKAGVAAIAAPDPAR
jgi:hypothetical protein